MARYRGETVMDVDLDFLTGGVRYERPYVLPRSDALRADEVLRDIQAEPQWVLGTLPAALGHRDVCSRGSIYRRYDGVVRGCTAIPAGFADAGVLVPIPGSPLGVAVGLGGNPRYGLIDPRRAAELAVAEAVAQVTAVGATPVALTDCLNFGDPTIPEQMGAFVAAVEGLADAAGAAGLPFVSGNVSFYNRSASGTHVAPSPIICCIGTFADVSTATGPGFKRAGSPVVVLQAPNATEGIGGSVLAELLGVPRLGLPRVDWKWFARACALVRESIATGAALSVHDVSDGGPLVAAAEMALHATSSAIGLRVGDAGLFGPRSLTLRYAEAPGFVVEVGDFEAFVALAQQHGVPLRLDMQTTDVPVIDHVDQHGAVVGAIDLATLREAWEAPLRDFYGSVA
jgi:phosphoribosylformylglycinamidine synthase